MGLKCTSCGEGLVGQEDFVRFNCPKCGEEEVVRCKRCRNLSVRYKCSKCNFEGP